MDNKRMLEIKLIWPQNKLSDFDLKPWMMTLILFVSSGGTVGYSAVSSQTNMWGEIFHPSALF